MVWPTVGSRTAKEQNRTVHTAGCCVDGDLGHAEFLGRRVGAVDDDVAELARLRGTVDGRLFADFDHPAVLTTQRVGRRVDRFTLRRQSTRQTHLEVVQTVLYTAAAQTTRDSH